MNDPIELPCVPATPLHECLACGYDRLETYLDYGIQPLGTLKPSMVPRANWPRTHLRLNWCPHCGHVQLAGAVDPKLLYDEYPRLESFRPDPHLESLARNLAARNQGRSGHCVEVGCGSGGFLALTAQTSGLRPIGIDAAENCLRAARDRGCETLRGYFDEQMAMDMRARHGPARIVVARHVVEHVPDAAGFVRALRHLCDLDTVVAIETPDFAWVTDRGDFTALTEQHLSYLSAGSLLTLLERTNLHCDELTIAPNRWTDALLVIGSFNQEEAQRPGRDRPRLEHQTHTAFVRSQDVVKSRLEKLAIGGAPALFGASCRASNLLNYLGLGEHAPVAVVVDDRADLHGLRLNGTAVPIAPPGALTDLGIKHCLICAINHEAAIRDRHRVFEEQGGRFHNLAAWLHEAHISAPIAR